MKVFEIEEVKPFMEKLFGTGVFYPFHLLHAEIKTVVSYILEGRKLEEKTGYIEWKTISGIIFQIIKGKKVPSLLLLVLEPEPEWLSERFPQMTEEMSFCLNIRFEQKEGERRMEDSLILTAGVSGTDFIKAHQMEEEWGRIMGAYLKENHIV